MPDLAPLDPPAAAAALAAAEGAARGFLGLDPVTQNAALLARELTRLGAQVFRSGDGLVGFALNDRQPRQAYLAATGPDPEPVRALLSFVTTYQRCSSYVALVPAGAPAGAAFADCGFTRAGTLPAHRYQAGGWQDVSVWFATKEDPCRS